MRQASNVEQQVATETDRGMRALKMVWIQFFHKPSWAHSYLTYKITLSLTFIFICFCYWCNFVKKCLLLHGIVL
jgi:hypothetical protein